MVVLLLFSFVCYSGETRQEEDAKRPGARGLEGVRTQPRAGLCLGSRTAPGRRPLPHMAALGTPCALPRLPPRSLRGGGARSPQRAGTAVVWPVSFPEFTQALPLAWQPGNLFQSRPPACPLACPLRTRRCHRRSRGRRRRRSHDAPRQPSPQWAAMLSE